VQKRPSTRGPDAKKESGERKNCTVDWHIDAKETQVVTRERIFTPVKVRGDGKKNDIDLLLPLEEGMGATHVFPTSTGPENKSGWKKGGVTQKTKIGAVGEIQGGGLGLGRSTGRTKKERRVRD